MCTRALRVPLLFSLFSLLCQLFSLLCQLFSLFSFSHCFYFFFIVLSLLPRHCEITELGDTVTQRVC